MVEGERRGVLELLSLPLCVATKTLPVGETLGVRNELELILALPLRLLDTVTEGEGLKDRVRLLDDVGTLLTLELVLKLP